MSAPRRGSARPYVRSARALLVALASPAVAAASAAAASVTAASVAVAQDSAATARAVAERHGERTLRWLGSVAEERARDASLLGGTESDGLLLRSASAPGGRSDVGVGSAWLVALTPTLRLSHNSALPHSLNDGAQWAGRGSSALARAGVDARLGRVRLVLAPEVAWAANAAFDVRPPEVPGRSPFASPWHGGRASIDLPSRFGDRPFTRVTLGQSTVVATVRAVALGASTENSWWGPGRWSALALSDNAEGFPHLFARTARPLRTRLGVVEGRYLLGTLVPSLFLDTTVTASWRAFNGVAATLRPAGASNLTLGVSRTTVAPLDRPRVLGAHALDALVRWAAPSADTSRRPRTDQLTALFARWAFPADHAEIYAEWARQTTPRSVRELLVAPQEGRALTLGARAMRPLARRGGEVTRYLRAEVEFTGTEQSITFRDRPAPQPFYTGLATREGYTHRGQLLGAAVGPGASAHWLAGDLVTTRGALGLVLGRVRWENDALYTQPNSNFFRHDVTTLLGVRAHARLPLADLRGEGSWARRYNYLFQNGFANPGGRRTVDVTNVTLVLAVTPR